MAALQSFARRRLAQQVLRSPATTRTFATTMQPNDPPSSWANPPPASMRQQQQQATETTSQKGYDKLRSSVGPPPRVCDVGSAYGLPTKRADTIEPAANRTFSRFDMSGKAVIVTGGGQGLGLSMAAGAAEAGAHVYCLDRSPTPTEAFKVAQSELRPFDGGQLHYRTADVTDTFALDQAITKCAEAEQRLDGVIAAAGIQKICSAKSYSVEDARNMLDVNFTGVLMTAAAAARQMTRFGTPGSICLIASMSGLIANKGLICPVYNASKAAVIQLARSLAMEWGRPQPNGEGGIRVNCLSPGNLVTPMVEKNFEEQPELKEQWENANMMGRIASPEEFKGAGLFLLSDASSYMTGNNLVIDGGYTAW